MRVLIASLSNLSYLAEYLVERGHEVALYQPRRVDLGEFRQASVRPDADLPYRLVTAPVWPLRPYPYSRFLWGFTPLLRQFRPRVLYLVGEPSELAVAQLVRLSRRHSPQTRIVDYSFENVPRTWQGFPRSLRTRAQRETLPRLDMILTASEGARQQLLRQGYPPERVRIVPLGVDPDLYRDRSGAALRAESGAGEDDFLIGFVGRLVPEKAVDLLLRSLAQLPARYRLVVVGDGREAGALRDLARALGVEERVHWAGRQEREQVARYLAAIDALVLPSRSIPQWQEQFGLVLVEAMHSGTPVIGSSSGAIPEVIGDAGLIFPEGDVDALAQALRRLGEDPALRAALGREGRARAARLYSRAAFLGGLASAIEAAAELPPRD